MLPCQCPWLSQTLFSESERLQIFCYVLSSTIALPGQALKLKDAKTRNVCGIIPSFRVYSPPLTEYLFFFPFRCSHAIDILYIIQLSLKVSLTKIVGNVRNGNPDHFLNIINHFKRLLIMISKIAYPDFLDR